MALVFGEPADLEQALDLAERALQGMPSHFSALQARIRALIMLGRLREAQQTARTLMSRYPQSGISAWRLRWPYPQAVVERMVHYTEPPAFPNKQPKVLWVRLR